MTHDTIKRYTLFFLSGDDEEREVLVEASDKVIAHLLAAIQFECWLEDGAGRNITSQQFIESHG